MSHLDFEKTRAGIFYLGFLMLLDAMDEFAETGRTRASLALEKARTAGMITAVDMVSTENRQFREIAESALPFTDYLIVNEIEAGKVVGMELKTADGTEGQPASRRQGGCCCAACVIRR